jgi:Fe2+ transport system protein FeoA
MSMPRYHTVGAVAQDLRALKALDERLEDLGIPAGSLLVLLRRKDERLVDVTLPDLRTHRVESGLSRTQWFELASTYLGVTAVSVLMGAVHPPTGIAVQIVVTLAAIIGLILYHRRPRLEKKLLAMGLPEELAEEWAGTFQEGFVLALATVPSDLFDETQDAFLEDSKLRSPLAVDRRPVL